MNDKFTDISIAIDRKLARHATPRPWEVHNTDDIYSMNVFYITRQGVPEFGEFSPYARESEFPHSDVLAITMIQTPRYADNTDAEDNANFICIAVNNYIDALDEIVRLRAQIEAMKAWIPAWAIEEMDNPKEDEAWKNL